VHTVHLPGPCARTRPPGERVLPQCEDALLTVSTTACGMMSRVPLPPLDFEKGKSCPMLLMPRQPHINCCSACLLVSKACQPRRVILEIPNPNALGNCCSIHSSDGAAQFHFLTSGSDSATASFSLALPAALAASRFSPGGWRAWRGSHASA
jgi:hypothetical protein